MTMKSLWKGGELPGTMGQGMSSQERDIFELFTKLLQQHGKSLPSRDLKTLFRRTAAKLPGVTEFTVLTTDLWDK